jgi:hypothetical protein
LAATQVLLQALLLLALLGLQGLPAAVKLAARAAAAAAGCVAAAPLMRHLLLMLCLQETQSHLHCNGPAVRCQLQKRHCCLLCCYHSLTVHGTPDQLLQQLLLQLR